MRSSNSQRAAGSRSMKEVDPEVAALLEDLPPVKLPPALSEAGWGRFSAADILQHRPDHQQVVTPEDQMAPVYKHTCVQCGRPITLSHQDDWAALLKWLRKAM